MLLMSRLRRPAVLAAVGALLAPLVIGSGAPAAVAAGAEATLAVTSFSVTAGAALAAPQPAADPAYATDRAYATAVPASTVTTALGYRCASDTEDCADAATTVVLGALRLTGPLPAAGLDPTTTVAYFTDAAATLPTADPTQAAAFRIAFGAALEEGGTGLAAGVSGTLTFDSTLVAPAGGGAQQGTAVATPSAAAGTGQPSRVRVTGEFPVHLATSTAVSWARAGFLSGVDDGADRPTNTATVVATLTGDPADRLAVAWGGADPSTRPAAGTTGMLTDLTDAAVTAWPAGAASVTVTGWRWTGASSAPAQVAVTTRAAAAADAGADLLAGLPADARAALTGLRLEFAAADGGLIAGGASATVVVGVREHGSAASTPVPRAGTADYVTDAPAAAFSEASDLNTLTVTGTAATTATRGATTSGASTDTRGFRIDDPRAYAGSATSLAPLSGGTVYGGGFVAATSSATNWSRRAVERLQLTVPATAAQVSATNALLDPDLPAVDTRVLGAGLAFAGFGTARSGDAGNGAGLVVTGLRGPATLTVTLRTAGGDVVRTTDAAAPVLATDAAAWGLTSWSQVEGFSAAVSGAGSAVPMGASVTVPYLLRAATAAQAQTYAAHTAASAVLGSDTSATTPRTARSGNRPVTAASIGVAVPTVSVAGSKYVVEPYVATTGGTATVVLEAVARAGASGHLPDTLVAEDSARSRGTNGVLGTAWWDLLRPVQVDGEVPAGADLTVEYYTNTSGAPEWQRYDAALSDLLGAESWRGLRLVTDAADGTTFADGTTARARITFAVRGTPLNGRTWAADATQTNAAQISSAATVEGNVVTSGTLAVSDTVVGVAPGGDGTASLVKRLGTRQGVEGAAGTSTATLTWGTDGRALASVAVTDANGVAGDDRTPGTGRDGSFWDAFDLTTIRPITSGAAAVAGSAYDPYLAFDQVTDLRVYDTVDGSWHSLATEEWTGAAWESRAGGRTDVTFGGTAAGAFPYAGSFPGATLSAGLQARVGGVDLVYRARTTPEREAAVAGDWRRALLPTLTDGAVATTDGPTREVQLDVRLRDTSRATGAPANDAVAYTGAAAGAVANSGRVTGWADPAAPATDLGGPANGSAWWTYQVRPASIGPAATKTWLRDANGAPLQPSTDLDQLALPVEGQDAAASAWPTATLTVTGRSTATAATTRVDALTVTEPRGIDTATRLAAGDPFAQFAITDVVTVSDGGTGTGAGVVTGATGVAVVLYRAAPDGTVTADAPVTRAVALGYSEAQLADVVGVQVRYTGRVQAERPATLTLATRLLAENRVTGAATPAGLTVSNQVGVTVSDARVCADESGAPLPSATCTPVVETATASAGTRTREPQVLAFPTLQVTPVDVQRDAAAPVVTSVLSAQNFGVTEADQLVVTAADARYVNAVAARTVRVDRLPTGAEEARLEVLVAGDDLGVDADGAYTGTQTWLPWGAPAGAGATWDLASLAAAGGVSADAVVGVRVRFVDTDGQRITAPGQGYGQATLAGVLREELLTGGLPSAVGAAGWRYDGAAELAANPGETARGVVTHRVTAQAVRDGLTSSAQETADVAVTVHAGAPTVRVQKAEIDPAPRKPGDHVRYRIAVTNTASGPDAADLTGLVVTDRLPEDGSLVLGTAPAGQQPVVVQGAGGAASPLGAPAAAEQDGTVTLTFGADDRLAPGATVEVLLWVRVATDLSSTSVVNTATAASASRPVVAAPTGADGGTACAPGSYDPTAAACLATAGSLTIGGANVYVSEEWVRDRDAATGAVRTTAPRPGAPSACAPRGTGADAGWYRYPCAVTSTAGTTTDWQVQVSSRATVSTARLEMVNMLPVVGDYPAMDGSATGSRGSAWRPVWDGTVPALVPAAGLPAGATLQVYTTTADYRTGGLPASADFDPVPGTWSSTALTPGQTVPAAQAARVTGFKLAVTFAAGDRFSEGESVRVGWSMRTPLTGVVDGVDTWNSFAFRVPADAGAGRPVDVTSVPLKAGARFAAAAFDASNPPVAVGDRVWLDADRDGVQDDGEPGVAGVGVDLYTGTGASAAWVAEATTDADGAWLVDGLPAGTYQVRLTLPAALAAQYRFTGTGAGATDVDSDAVADADGALIADVVVGLGEPGTVAVADMPAAWRAAHPGLTATHVDATRDAGLQWRPLAVGDRVWADTDRDGRLGPGEGPVAGAAVRLLGAGDAVLAAATTGADGSYRFDGLDPGTYRVEVELPDALAGRWTFTAPLAAGTPDGDSDVVAVTARLGRTAAFTLSPGDPALAAVSDLAGDPVWAGAEADYADPTRDAGLVERSVRVGDRVWADTDGDGVQDAGEPGLAGVVLTLADGAGDPVTDASGAVVGPVTTDADGAYAFAGLLPGGYTVTVDEAASAAVLAPYVRTATGAGDAATDSSAGSATTAVALLGGQADDTLDFGYRPLRALGDRVWLDADRDGVQDVGEPSFPGVTVRLLDAGGALVGTTVTDADGRWRFDLLEPGTYALELGLTPEDAARYTWTTARSAAAPRADADSDAEETGPGAARMTGVVVGPDAPGVRAATAADGLTAVWVDDTWDAGLVERTVAVGDLVWSDEDRDGVQDPGEPGVPGVVVELRTPDGRAVTDASGDAVGPATTGADGVYGFTGLLPGEYVVRVDRTASAAALAGYGPTVEGAGGDTAADSSTWTATSRVLVGGESDTTLDFGVVLADDVQLALRKVAASRTADSITWDVTVTATGTQDAYAGFTVRDVLPAALTLRSAGGTGFACAPDGREVVCAHDGPLAAGESATVRLVTGLATAGADIANTATVDVDGRGYRFDVPTAEDVAWSEPVEPADGGTAPGTGGAGGAAAARGDLATTGSDPAWPLAAAGALLALGAALVALASGARPVRRARAAGSRQRA